MNDMSAWVFWLVVFPQQPNLPVALDKIEHFLGEMMSDNLVDTATTPFSNPVHIEKLIVRKYGEAQQRRV
jgi:hypothetical protein